MSLSRHCFVSPAIAASRSRLLGLVALLLGLTPSIWAASHYIRIGATGAGNGSSWTDAWPTFAAATWTRGDVYYVADGVYNEDVNVNPPGTGTDWVTVRKATAADHGTSTGWTDTDGDGQAVIEGTVTLNNGYVRFDGATGGGYRRADGTGAPGYSTHGFRVHVSKPDAPVMFRLGASGARPGPYEALHTEVEGPGFSAGSTTAAGGDGFYCVNPLTVSKGLHLSNCWLHEVPRNGATLIGLAGTSYSDYGFLIEHCVFSEAGGTPNLANHAQGLELGYSVATAYAIVRDSVIRNTQGTAMMALLGNTSGGTAAKYHDLQIYNNVFYITDNSRYKVVSPAVVYGSSLATSCQNVLVANNTFFNIGPSTANNSVAQCAIDTPGASGNVLANNVWEHCYFSATHRGFATQSNNGYYGNTGAGVAASIVGQVVGSSTALPTAAAEDFRLASGSYAVGRAQSLSTVATAPLIVSTTATSLDTNATITTDYTDMLRGSSWDMGAFQFNTTVIASDPVPAPAPAPSPAPTPANTPVAPMNVRITVTGG